MSPPTGVAEPISDEDLWLCRMNLPGQLDSPILVTQGHLAEFGLRLIARIDRLTDERDALKEALRAGWTQGQYEWAIAHPDELGPSHD